MRKRCAKDAQKLSMIDFLVLYLCMLYIKYQLLLTEFMTNGSKSRLIYREIEFAYSLYMKGTPYKELCEAIEKKVGVQVTRHDIYHAIARYDEERRAVRYERRGRPIGNLTGRRKRRGNNKLWRHVRDFKVADKAIVVPVNPVVPEVNDNPKTVVPAPKKQEAQVTGKQVQQDDSLSEMMAIFEKGISPSLRHERLFGKGESK